MFAFTYAQVFATTNILAEVVFILPSLRRGQPLFGGAPRYCPLFSRPLLSQRVLYTIAPYCGAGGNRTRVQTTFNIRNYLHDSQLRRLARTRDDQSVIYHHHLLLLAVSKKSARAKDSMNLKYLPLGRILFWREG